MSSPNEALSITLLLGGVRAGKSARALQLAATHSQDSSEHAVLFVATAQAFDTEMQKRISVHKAERPAGWSTLEEPIEIASGISKHLSQHPDTIAVVVDCLTLWVSNILLNCSENDDVEWTVTNRTRELLNVMQVHSMRSSPSGHAPRHWIVVSNEVGLGVVPPTLLGRQYRDALGRANQLMAAAATSVTLMVAGLELPLKVSPHDGDR